MRSGSTGSLGWDSMVSRADEEDMRCVRLHSTRAHQQPITVLQTEGGRVLTGSQDHTLKVFQKLKNVSSFLSFFGNYNYGFFLVGIPFRRSAPFIHTPWTLWPYHVSFH